MFVAILFVLFIISFLWALWSLRGLTKNQKITQSVKKELSTGRVVFHGDHSKVGHASSSVDSSAAGSGLE